MRQARALGRAALDAGLGVFDLIRLHHQALTDGVLPEDTAAAARLAPSLENFLLAALAPFEAANRGIHSARERLQQLNGVLAERNEALALSNAQLEEEILLRQQNETALRQSKDRYFELLRQAQAMEDGLHDLSAQVLAAQDDDRKRISRELHEEIAQALAAVNLTVALLKKQAGAGSTFQRDVAAAEALLAHSMETVHSFARTLRPAALDHLGVQSALQDHAAEFSRQTGIPVEFSPHPALDRLDSRAGEVLFRIVQESLSQIFRETATAIKMTATGADDMLHLEITSQRRTPRGAGKPAARPADRLVLLGLQERARSINGLFAIEPLPHGGTHVTIQIPLQAPAGEPDRVRGAGPAGFLPLMKKITVLLADDHTMIRQGLRTLLSNEPDIEVVAEADNGRQAVQLAQQLRPDVVVMDIAMPQLNGLEATRQIVGEDLAAKLLILSSYADSEYVHQLTAAGASGYLIKQTAASELINAVREVSRGNAFFSPSVLKRLLEYYRESCLKGRPLQQQQNEQLTSREQEVLQLVAEGYVNKQIASALCISIKTVEKHRQQLMNNLDLHDLAGPTRYSISHGPVENRRRLREAAGGTDWRPADETPAKTVESGAPARAMSPQTTPSV